MVSYVVREDFNASRWAQKALNEPRRIFKPLGEWTRNIAMFDPDSVAEDLVWVISQVGDVIVISKEGNPLLGPRARAIRFVIADMPFESEEIFFLQCLERCPACKGLGAIASTSRPCFQCKATGQIRLELPTDEEVRQFWIGRANL